MQDAASVKSWLQQVGLVRTAVKYVIGSQEHKPLCALMQRAAINYCPAQPAPHKQTYGSGSGVTQSHSALRSRRESLPRRSGTRRPRPREVATRPLDAVPAALWSRRSAGTTSRCDRWRCPAAPSTLVVEFHQQQSLRLFPRTTCDEQRDVRSHKCLQQFIRLHSSPVGLCVRILRA